MGYRAGVVLLKSDKQVSRETGPYIFCDRCRKIVSVFNNRNHHRPAKWFLDGKPVPGGWITSRRDDGTRVDYCLNCKYKTNEQPSKE